MSWWTNLKKAIRYNPPPPCLESASTPEEAEAARERARRALTEAQTHRKKIDEVTTALAALRERNHFGESIEQAMLRRNRA